MKKHFLVVVICWASVLSSAVAVQAADPPAESGVHVLSMSEIPPALYEVRMQLSGRDETVRLLVRNKRAEFVEASTGKLEGLAGEFELIGNGVFLARLAGTNHRATQWWVFQPDGTATVKEVPDRGERQTAQPVKAN